MEQTGAIMLTTIKSLLRNETGATAIEYGMIAALISVAMVTSLTTVGANPYSHLLQRCQEAYDYRCKSPI